MNPAAFVAACVARWERDRCRLRAVAALLFAAMPAATIAPMRSRS